MYGHDILCGIAKVPFEILHKVSCPYIERCLIYLDTKMYKLMESRACQCFWDSPLMYGLLL